MPVEQGGVPIELDIERSSVELAFVDSHLNLAVRSKGELECNSKFTAPSFQGESLGVLEYLDVGVLPTPPAAYLYTCAGHIQDEAIARRFHAGGSLEFPHLLSSSAPYLRWMCRLYTS